eukprot:scaffold8353_cov138-Cylindrotheca_fusiformis.AAC.42
MAINAFEMKSFGQSKVQGGGVQLTSELREEQRHKRGLLLQSLSCHVSKFGACSYCTVHTHTRIKLSHLNLAPRNVE